MIDRAKLLAAVSIFACLALGANASAALGLAPSWQPVAVTGPTVVPALQSETQKVYVDAEGGTFTLTARHLAGEGVGVRMDIFRLKDILTLSGSFAAGQRIEGLSAGINPGTTVTGVGPGTLTINPSMKGTNAYYNYKQATFATYDQPETTSPLAVNADAGEVQAALEALSVVGAGNVEVTGPAGGPYTVVFKGDLADTNVSQLIADSSSLVGGHASSSTPSPGGSGFSILALMAKNNGGGSTTGETITYKATIPPGFSSVGTPVTEGGTEIAPWDCSASTATEILCTRSEVLRPFLALSPIHVLLRPDPGNQSGVVQTEISGGGTSAPATFDLPLSASTIPAGPGMQAFVAGAYDENGNVDTVAGGHPYSASVAIFANTALLPNGNLMPTAMFRDIITKIPPGFLGNPIAVPECPESTPSTDCPLDTMVGVVQPAYGRFGNRGVPFSVTNTEAPYGYPAKYRFDIEGAVALSAVGLLRSDEDYGITAASINTPVIDTVYGVFFTFWGEPAASAHDQLRCLAILPQFGCVANDSPNTALLTSASNCAEQAATQPVTPLLTTFWDFPGLETQVLSEIPPVKGCENLKFKSDFTFEPSDTKSDSPASFRTSLTQPSVGLTDPTKLANPPIKEAVVDLPEGVTLNPSGADGLQACSLEQVGYLGNDFPMPNPMRFNKEPNQCPDASKIGIGELKTELLSETLKGALYLAAQGNGNPYGSLFALYLVIEDPRHGIFIKLPGRVDADPQTGKLTTTFENLPQIPFTRLDLTLKGGNRSALASPTTCGNFVTKAINTPWSFPGSGPPTESANGFTINQGPNGLPCAPTPGDRPFDVSMNAGTDSVAAGSFSPLTFHLTRPDGSQEIETLELTTAPGLAASLKGVSKCSDEAIARASSSTGREEQSNPACSSASKIGRLVTGAGAGPTPFYTGGSLYLAGPYKGAPLSVVAITPAVAGPFDLGNVVVRTALFLNRSTAQVTAKADPIPQVLEGVPLRIRDIQVILDRPGFSLNPTSCEANAITAKLNGNSGATANLSSRFQVAGCQDLAFKPKFSAKLIGGTKRGDHPAFVAEVKWPQGAYANTKNVAVTLPRSEFLDQANIRTICTRVQAAADTCPPGAIYGEAEATTPLLDEPLRGPVFLKSSDNKLPDLAIKLKGPASMPIEVEFQGRIDSIKGQIRDTIEGLPDVPVTKFVLKMQGGRKGLLVNSRNLCVGKKGRMDVRMLGQNNKRADQRPVLKNSCKKAKKKKKRKGAKKRAKR